MVALILSTVFSGVLAGALGQSVTVPFNGLQLTYEGKTEDIVKTQTGISGSSTLKLTFSDVTSISSKMTVNVQGELTVGGTKQTLAPVTTTADFPTNRDTLIYLTPSTDPPSTSTINIYAGPIDEATFAGINIKYSGDWRYDGTGQVVIPLGRFNAYKYKISVQSVPTPFGGSLDIDIIAYYETASKVLIFGEIIGKQPGSFLQARLIRIQLQQTNLQFAGSRGCLIATATYGSELSDEVQTLRTYRDSQILSTQVGAAFMKLFDEWYYSFSPIVASAISTNQNLRGGMKILLYPLILILSASSHAYMLLGSSREISALLSGLLASTMIGAVYVSPGMAVLLAPLAAGKKSRRMAVAMKSLASTSVLGLMAIAVGTWLSASFLTVMASIQLVIAALLMGGLGALYAIKGTSS